MTEYLDDLNDAFKCAWDQRPPDGIYHAKVIKAQVGKSKEGNRQVRMDLKFTNPLTSRAYFVQKYHSLELEWIRYLAWDLDRISIPEFELGRLPEVLRKIIGATIEIDFRESGDWYDIDFIRLVSWAE